eukprot:199860-Prorocentrum_minimum.AAC.9
MQTRKNLRNRYPSSSRHRKRRKSSSRWGLKKKTHHHPNVWPVAVPTQKTRSEPQNPKTTPQNPNQPFFSDQDEHDVARLAKGIRLPNVSAQVSSGRSLRHLLPSAGVRGHGPPIPSAPAAGAGIAPGPRGGRPRAPGLQRVVRPTGRPGGPHKRRGRAPPANSAPPTGGMVLRLLLPPPGDPGRRRRRPHGAREAGRGPRPAGSGPHGPVGGGSGR